MPRHASIFDMVSRERLSCPLRTLETYCWLQLINSESCFPMALRIGAIAGSCLPIAYATSVSPPNEAVAWQGRRYPMGDKAVAWPGCKCPMGDKAVAWPDAAFLQITARTNPRSRHLWGTLARAVASICAHRARPKKLIV